MNAVEDGSCRLNGLPANVLQRMLFIDRASDKECRNPASISLARSFYEQ